MEEPAESVDLVCLVDPSGTSSHSVSVRVLKGLQAGSELLDCEIAVTTATVTGSFPVFVTPFDMECWDKAGLRSWPVSFGWLSEYPSLSVTCALVVALDAERPWP